MLLRLLREAIDGPTPVTTKDGKPLVYAEDRAHDAFTVRDALTALLGCKVWVEGVAPSRGGGDRYERG